MRPINSNKNKLNSKKNKKKKNCIFQPLLNTTLILMKNSINFQFKKNTKYGFLLYKIWFPIQP